MLRTILTKLRHEPVAVWGALLALLVGVLHARGVSDDLLATVTGAASLLGVPVLRSMVTPVVADPPPVEGEAGASLLEVCAVVVALVLFFAFFQVSLRH